MKIVLIGAGSFVFAPTVLRDAIVKHRLAGELALVDLNLGAAEAMAGVGRRMACDEDVACTITVTAERREALAGADFVILSAAPEGARRWWMDYEILKDAGIPDQARECGGLGGLSYALRTISLALDVAEDMRTYCPGAVLLDVTNPMPRVVTALRRFTQIASYGFCNASHEGATGYEWLAGLLGRKQEDIEVVTAGLNHFTWVVSVRDRATGADLYPQVEAAVRADDGHGAEIRRRWLDRYGAIAAVGPSHAKDFLPYDPDIRYGTRPPFHGDADERAARLRLLHAIAVGEADWRTAKIGGSWEHPLHVAAALHSGATLDVPMLNVPNTGALPDLPNERIVEVPAVVEAGALRPKQVGPLPGRTGPLCRAVSDVHELVAEGAATGDRDALARAIQIDPAVGDTSTALQALDRMLAAHADLLRRFA